MAEEAILLMIIAVIIIIVFTIMIIMSSIEEKHHNIMIKRLNQLDSLADNYASILLNISNKGKELKDAYSELVFNIKYKEKNLKLKDVENEIEDKLRLLIQKEDELLQLSTNQNNLLAEDEYFKYLDYVHKEYPLVKNRDKNYKSLKETYTNIKYELMPKKFDIQDLKKTVLINQYQEFIRKLDDLDAYIEQFEYEEENDDPVESINNLKGILDVPNLYNENEIWNILYDEIEFLNLNVFDEFQDMIVEYEQKEKEFYELSYLYFNSLNENEYSNFLKKTNDINPSFSKEYTDLSSLKESLQNSKDDILFRKTLMKEKLAECINKWSLKYQEILKGTELKKNKIDLIKKGYYNCEKESIENYYNIILSSISYYNKFNKEVVTEFNPLNKVLIVEYLLPSINVYPNIKERRYIKTRNEIKDIYYSERELNSLYEDITYRIVLDQINKVFQFDYINQVKTIVFNGWTKSINKATGLINEACILSVSCNKDEYLKINLQEVDPKECFKGLKGISAHKISNLTPIKPIITINQNDKRFVSAHNVEIDSSTNLASMNWEDFEHLIREIFEKEFASNGGNVKVTQSSRDGGVDAIAFDPDPIRGGKIVIQAKRYTNIVGVSAVRDLYGTVLNEGATKGILVTTSDYGSDSYKFAKDKPLTLLNGSNLLHLLEKHNYKARINIREAREGLK